MELKNHFVLYIGILIFVLLFSLFFIKFNKKENYKGGKKVVNTLYTRDEPYFKRKMLTYRILSVLMIAACVMGIAVSFIMLARPYKTKTVNKEKYSRDIILCIDVSTSVDYLNKNLVEELKETVNNLKGERFGIVIFNASPVLLSPLTDDYEFIIEQLDLIEQSLDMRIRFNEGGYLPDNWFYLDTYISGGTLVGAEERGSSLIGDGLAASVYDFSDLEEERTRIVIFSTDNDIQGTPLVTLEEAADICKENNVTVFGIGTKEMTEANKQSMQDAVLYTGGAFYLEEESGTFAQIVSEIEKKSKSLIKGSTEIQEIELVEIPFILLLFSVMAMIVLTKIIKR
ncbi:MAG: hypothetical protein J6L77_00990 [Coprococcus sp.]|nr:hypothetical protein [Coprococcus sp.]